MALASAVVVVDGLRHVNDAHPLRVGRQAPLILVETIRGSERTVAADRDKRVEAELDEPAVHVVERLRLVSVLEVGAGRDLSTGPAAAGADDDAALVSEPGKIAVFEHPVVLAGFEPRFSVGLERREPIQDTDDFRPSAPERARRDGDDRVPRRRGAAREHDTHAPWLTSVRCAHSAKSRCNNRCRLGSF